MGLSADTLFHFTPDIRWLKSILLKGLWVRYSFENFEGIIERNSEILIPMICFCDIPISQALPHAETYGYYGLGLNKEWGFRNSLSPVIYAYPNSRTAKLLNEVKKNFGLFYDVEKTMEKDVTLEEYINIANLKTLFKNDGDVLPEILRDFAYLIQFIKPYNGTFRGRENVKFYDEREWRYVPGYTELAEKGFKANYNGEFYHDKIKRRYLKIKTADKITLQYEPDEVKFIIVKTDDEIPDLIDFIWESYQGHISDKAIKLLTSKIISINQIHNDIV